MSRASFCRAVSATAVLAGLTVAPTVPLSAEEPGSGAVLLPKERSSAPGPGTTDWTFQVRIAEPATARAVRQALAGAYERLGDASCSAVLEDFTDGSGSPLTARLSDGASSPRAVLKSMLFYDGSSRHACRSDLGVQATTEPGSRVVMICGLRFFEKHISKPARSEIWMIHEMLHTLGLRENPPSSREITRAVMRRCLNAPRTKGPNDAEDLGSPRTHGS